MSYFIKWYLLKFTAVKPTHDHTLYIFHKTVFLGQLRSVEVALCDSNMWLTRHSSDSTAFEAPVNSSQHDVSTAGQLVIRFWAVTSWPCDELTGTLFYCIQYCASLALRCLVMWSVAASNAITVCLPRQPRLKSYSITITCICVCVCEFYAIPYFIHVQQPAYTCWNDVCNMVQPVVKVGFKS